MKRFSLRLAFFLTVSVSALLPAWAQQELAPSSAQGAQVPQAESVPQAVPIEAAPESEAAKARLETPQDASVEQAERIAKANRLLAKAVLQDQAGQSTGVSKVARTAMKKLTKKLDRLGAAEAGKVKALKEASAAKANKNVTLGIVLAAIGLILTLVTSGTLATVGVILLVVGIVVLILGIID